MAKGYRAYDHLFLVALDNVLLDITEMEKGMGLTRRELEMRVEKEREPPVILRDFLNNSEDKLKKLRQDSKSAQVGYR